MTEEKKVKRRKRKKKEKVETIEPMEAPETTKNLTMFKPRVTCRAQKDCHFRYGATKFIFKKGEDYKLEEEVATFAKKSGRVL